MQPEIQAALTVDLQPLEEGLSTVLEDPGGAGYDRKARMYDRLVGSPLYNRWIWGLSVDWYGAVAERAAASGTGPLLEGGCGTALFTREAWSATERPLLLLDRSVDMLRVARERVGDAATLVQADLFDLPLKPGSFETVCSFGVVHVLDDPSPALEQLWSCVAPGGQLWITSIVDTGRWAAKAWYAGLRIAGEVAPARTAEDLAEMLEAITGTAPQVEVEGAFARLTVQRSRI